MTVYDVSPFQFYAEWIPYLSGLYNLPRKTITTGTYLLVKRLHNITPVGEAIGLLRYG